MSIKIYAVGGSIRDEILGIPSEDHDFCVICPSYDEMRNYLVEKGAKIYLERPEYYAIRCKLEPFGDADFVLGRKDGFYSDNRRPDAVEIVSCIEDELARRDFTSGAIARDADTGLLIDPFGGIQDTKNRFLKCVGDTRERFTEDSLRLLRSIRFSVTKQFTISSSIQECLKDPSMIDLLGNISVERSYEELLKMFSYSTLHSLKKLEEYPLLKNKIFKDGKLWLSPTLKNKKATQNFIG